MSRGPLVLGCIAVFFVMGAGWLGSTGRVLPSIGNYPAAAAVINDDKVTLLCRSQQGVARLEIYPSKSIVVMHGADGINLRFENGKQFANGCYSHVKISEASFEWSNDCDGDTVENSIDRYSGSWTYSGNGITAHLQCERGSNRPQF